MYGIGHGLGKMMEGATAGASQGMMQKMMFDREDKQRQEDTTYRDKTLQMNEDNLIIQRSTQALKTAWNIAKTSPNPNEVFSSVYSNLNPGAEVPTIKINPDQDEVEINYNDISITGLRNPVMDAINIISQKPEVTADVLGQLVTLGLAKVDVKNKTPEKPSILSPGQQMVGPDGKVIYSSPESQNKGYTPQQLVDDTRGYYKFLTDALMDPSGKYVRPGREEAYNEIINRLDHDLQAITAGQQPSWRTGAITRKNVKPEVPGETNKKLIFDPTTGEFTEK